MNENDWTNLGELSSMNENDWTNLGELSSRNEKDWTNLGELSSMNENDSSGSGESGPAKPFLENYKIFYFSFILSILNVQNYLI